MPRKSFHAAVAMEPISFDLQGLKSGFRNFPCRDRLAAGTLMKFAETFAGIEEEGEEGKGAEAIPAVREFFDKTLMPEGRQRFWDMINDDDEGITLDVLVDIAGWLSEQYSGGRPTTEISAAGSPEISSGAVSPATPSLVATPTYSRPEPMPSSIS